jgi:hypothetical protein
MGGLRENAIREDMLTYERGLSEGDYFTFLLYVHISLPFVSPSKSLSQITFSRDKELTYPA